MKHNRCRHTRTTGSCQYVGTQSAEHGRITSNCRSYSIGNGQDKFFRPRRALQQMLLECPGFTVIQYFPQFDLGSKSGGTSWDRKQFQNRHNSMTKNCSCQHQLPAVKLGNSFQWGAWQKQNPYYSVKVLYEKVNVKREQI